MSNLIYNGRTHVVELIDEKGHASVGNCTAYNNIDFTFAKKHYDLITHLKNGTYRMLDRKVRIRMWEIMRTEVLGLMGILRFNVQAIPA